MKAFGLLLADFVSESGMVGDADFPVWALRAVWFDIQFLRWSMCIAQR